MHPAIVQTSEHGFERYIQLDHYIIVESIFGDKTRHKFVKQDLFLAICTRIWSKCTQIWSKFSDDDDSSATSSHWKVENNKSDYSTQHEDKVEVLMWKKKWCLFFRVSSDDQGEDEIYHEDLSRETQKNQWHLWWKSQSSFDAGIKKRQLQHPKGGQDRGFWCDRK